MPETAAQIGLGSKFGIKNGSTYTDTAEVKNITLPGWTRNTVDVTHLQSPDGWAEFIAGLKTASDCTFTINWVPAISDPLVTAFEAGKGEFQIAFPSGTLAMQFAGIVTNYTPGEISPEGALSAQVTIKPSGKPTLATIPATP
ncbi:phage tail tube protein [Paracoccus sp. PAR01]|uniref:phage tail tube protein n=1 Tax=Paracoccus sp. PAR01 TaxID=2769282 RepID=UPI001783E1C5|nr:phage tail tube protein [Paracoccus sp. PAR01]MBD9528381.1 outer capsid protein Hoc [Paracoccus sp. PAR01]